MSKKNYGIISTWRMSFEGLIKAFDMISNNKSAGDAVEVLIKDVEDYPFYKSVGYGGLPNKEGHIQLDASYMDGDTLQIGALAAASTIKNPISVAKALSKNKVNNFLVGDGADKYALEHGFETGSMLTDRACKIWENKVEELKNQEKIYAYDGHDTVGAIALDKSGTIVSATSTSGLFMKEPGRVGDSPLSGSGFYADSRYGAAAATGLGEDLMKGVVSYEIVRKISQGIDVQHACNQTIYDFAEDLHLRNKNADDLQLSVIAMDMYGNWGVATTVEFTFCIALDVQKPQIFISWPDVNKKTKIEKISQEWLDNYDKRIHMKV